MRIVLEEMNFKLVLITHNLSYLVDTLALSTMPSIRNIYFGKNKNKINVTKTVVPKMASILHCI